MLHWPPSQPAARAPRKRTGAHALAGVLAGLTAGPLSAQPLPPPPARGVPAAMTLYLELVVNELASGQVVPVQLRDGQYHVAAAQLQALHVRTGSGPQELVAVGRLPGVTVQYDSVGQRLKIQVPPEWLPAQSLGARGAAGPVPARTDAGLLLNYDAYAGNIGRTGAYLSVWSEQRVFGPWGLLSNTGVQRQDFDGGGSGYIRYDTRWSSSDVDRIRTLTVGDLVTAGVPWGSAVRLGGVQLARNFAVRPDLVTYPLPRFSGQAAVPSAVDLFINGYKAGSEQVQPGPFTLNTVPFINGAGEASVVTTDALGRQVVTTVPFYVANTLLQQGGSDYAAAAGALRRGYGQRNFDYGPAVATGSYRFGLTDAITLEAHAEGARALGLLGVGAVGALGSLGVANAAISQSRLRGEGGRQLQFGYQYSAQRFGFAWQHSRRSSAFGDLAVYDTRNLRLPRRSSQATGNIALPDGAGSLAAGYFDLLGADGQRTRLASLSYSRALGQAAFLSVNFNRSIGQRDRNLQLLLTLPFDESGMVSTAVVRDRRNTTQQVGYSRSAPPGGGFGWNLSYAGGGDAPRYRQASGTWRSAYAQVQGGVFQQGSESGSWLGASGSVVAMDGGLFAANRVNDAFVLVSSGGVPDVTVRFENQVLGRTDVRGHLLLPSVTGYYPAHVEVDTLELPDYMQVQQGRQRVAVPSGGGAVVRFSVQQTIAAQIVLVDEHGRALPVGAAVEHQPSGRSTVVGYDGLVYLEGLAPDNELLVRTAGGAPCRARFALPGDRPQVLRLGPLACQPPGAPAR